MFSSLDVLFHFVWFGLFFFPIPNRGISSRRTLLTNLSFTRQRSNGTLINGSIVSRNGNVNDIGCGHHTNHSTADTINSPPHHNNHRNSSGDNRGISNVGVRSHQVNGTGALNNKYAKEEELNNRKNSIHHNNPDSQCLLLKESPPSTHICICNNKILSKGSVIENHV